VRSPRARPTHNRTDHITLYPSNDCDKGRSSLGVAETYWYVLCLPFHNTDRVGQTADGLLMMPLVLGMLGADAVDHSA
jgi:hypothetical protein